MRQLEQGIDYLGPPSWHDYSTPQIEAIRTHSSYLGVPFDRREGRYGAWFVLWGFRGGGVVGDRFGEGGIAAGGMGVGLDGGTGAVGPPRAAGVIAGDVVAGRRLALRGKHGLGQAEAAGGVAAVLVDGGRAGAGRGRGVRAGQRIAVGGDGGVGMVVFENGVIIRGGAGLGQAVVVGGRGGVGDRVVAAKNRNCNRVFSGRGGPAEHVTEHALGALRRTNFN